MRKLRVTVDGKVFEVTVEILDEGQPETPEGPSGEAAPVNLRAGEPIPPSSARAVDPGMVRSPVSGKVVSVDVNAGDEVHKGDRLITVEAMKMNNYVNAPHEGRVSKILVDVGAPVEKGQPLLQIL